MKIFDKLMEIYRTACATFTKWRLNIDMAIVDAAHFGTSVDMKVHVFVVRDPYMGIRIGSDEVMFYVPETLILQRRMTSNSIVIMGATTFRSHMSVPYRNCMNIVIVHDMDVLGEAYRKYEDEYGCLRFVSSAHNALVLAYALCHGHNRYFSMPDVYIIGGAQTYESFLDEYSFAIDDMYMVYVDKDFHCDREFPYSLLFYTVYETPQTVSNNGVSWHMKRCKNMIK